MPYCDKCGKPVVSSDKFCRQCGGLLPLSSSIDTLKIEPPVKSQANTTPIQKNNIPPPAQPSRYRTCKACGTTIHPGERYCSKCLVLVPDLPPVVIPPDQLPPPPRQVFR
jgi:predicted nucleic acid-binding Zn ribbon protein